MERKILNTINNYTEKAKQILEDLGDVDFIQLTQEELKEKIKECDIAVIGLGLQFDREIIEAAESLKVIATATTGLDHVDLDFAKEKGIEILSLRGETEFLSTITGTAEIAFGLMLDLMRGISPSFESVKKYEWDRESFRGNEVKGKTLGIVGLGRLGQMVVRYGKAFGMNVISYDPNKSVEEFEQFGVEQVSFDELIAVSDVISIHVHLNDETENMFDDSVFEKMKSTAYLINTARGKIVNEDDLLEALEENKIAGYATDVLSGELNFHESFANHPLVEYAKKNSNCIITPHIGGMTHESREATDVFIAEKLKSWTDK